ncbi:hypothetical protein CEXT_769701 [Caerostris extrusa]|uniref:Uncharacterized protein n=1 Tax=Caerostris extrusa TaxID=172846 RepID=A0AAV4NXE6_CAEEX|nr:hypothetical protein CEXT_769701 [Caerostris extrusa]
MVWGKVMSSGWTFTGGKSSETRERDRRVVLANQLETCLSQCGRNPWSESTVWFRSNQSRFLQHIKRISCQRQTETFEARNTCLSRSLVWMQILKTGP